MRKPMYLCFSLIFLLLCSAFITAQGMQRVNNGRTSPVAQRGEKVMIPADIQARLDKLREEIRAKGYTFEVGYNPAMRYSLDELCGLKFPKQNLNHQNENVQPVEELVNLPSSFDWRSNGGLSPVKNQGSCGSCWAFAAIGVFEGEIKIQDGTTVDLSEQYLISCNNDGWGCNGGWCPFGYFVNPGAALESCMPYTASDSSCNSSCSHPYKADSWSYISGQGSIPSVSQIKSAIYQYGPVWAAVYADSAFQAYTGGVFNEGAGGQPNHAIVLCGWDDSKGAWILRNSWGTSWGVEGGYMYIAYGSNSVGNSAAYLSYSGSNPNPQPNDPYEPNDSASQAYGAINSGQNYDKAEISSSSDADWFYFDIPATGTISVSVNISSSADLDCYLYKSSDTSNYVARGYTTNNPETCTYNATSTGRYYVKVVGYNGATSGYTLKVTYPSSNPNPDTDPYEPNDSASQAYGAINSGQNYDKAEISSSSDADWFYFSIPATGTITVSVDSATGKDLDWYLYKESNTSSYVARGYTANNPEVGSYDATSTGKYYVKVVGYNGATDKYTLKVTYPSSNPTPDENLALNKPVTASSYYSTSYPPENAVDGNTSSFWATKSLSSAGTTQYIYVNLESVHNISKIKIKWSTNNYPTTYYIQRWDGSNWINVSQVSGDGSWDTINYTSPFSAQYVRVYCTANHASYYTIYELEIY